MAKRRTRGSISKRGDRWYFRVTLDGRRTTRGSWKRQKDAERALAEFLGEVDEQADLDARQEIDLAVFVAETYDALMRSRLAPLTYEKQSPHLATWAKRVEAMDPIPTMRQVTRQHVEDWLVELRGKGFRKRTILHRLSVLSQCWQAAIERGYAEVNPFRGHRLPKDHEIVVPWLSPTDVPRLLARVRPRTRPFVQFLLETGLRQGEARALHWPDVDFDRRRVLVRKTKNRRSRDVPLLPSTIALLKQLRARPYVVTMRAPERVFAGLLSKDSVRMDLDAATAAAGIPHLRVHDLRHVYASHLVQSGVPVPTVAALLGHSDGGALVLRRYGRWMPSDAAATAVSHLERFRAAGSTTPGAQSA